MKRIQKVKIREYRRVSANIGGTQFSLATKFRICTGYLNECSSALVH